jgi:hypothetical protein
MVPASQRRRVTPWVQARLLVPASNSRASSGAPQNSPNSSGTTTVAYTSALRTPSPRNSRLWPSAQVCAAAQVSRKLW